MSHSVLHSQHPADSLHIISVQEVAIHSFNRCVLSTDNVIGYLLDNKDTVMNNIDKSLPLWSLH